MSFTEEFRYKEIFSIIKDLYCTFDGWEEYDPCMCGEEVELQNLSEELELHLKKCEEIVNKMCKINVDSFGC
jgi:hypothetical protein